jgi:hypothetical protein
MSSVSEPPNPPETDLIAEVRRVLQSSPEPLTLSKIRAQLPAPLRGVSLEDLADNLRRQVAAGVVIQYPKYRSQQDRFWDRPMPVHVAHLLRVTLEEGPLAWSELRRKLPAYAVGQAEAVLQEQLAQGRLYRLPRLGPRGKDRFGTQPADPKDYLRPELEALFGRLQQLGFTETQLRAGAMELLHNEQWAAAGAPPAPAAQTRDEREETPAGEEADLQPAASAPGEGNPY